MGISLNAAALLSGNGIDVNSLVNQIQSQQSGQLKVWQQEQTDLQTQATALTTLEYGSQQFEDCDERAQRSAGCADRGRCQFVNACDPHGYG